MIIFTDVKNGCILQRRVCVMSFYGFLPRRYPMYLDTYPPDTGSSPEPRTTVIQPARTMTPEMIDVVYRAKLPKAKTRRPVVRKTVSLTQARAQGGVCLCVCVGGGGVGGGGGSGPPSFSRVWVLKW